MIARPLLLALLLLCAACATPPPVTEDPQQALDTVHRYEGRFFNPWAPFKPDYAAAVAALFKPNRYRGQDFGAVPRADNAAQLLHDTQADSISWIGHASMLIRDSGDAVLTDPHFFDWALMIKRSTPPGLTIEQIPRPRFAVISHNHYDHLDDETVAALPADMPWLVPLGLADWFREQGRDEVIELDWWQSTELAGWRVTCVPVQHWSRRLGQPTNSTLWCGWMLESPARRRYFFAGDTGYFHGFREIARRFGPIDVAMLPIGAHYPESFLAYQHMNPQQALQAFVDLKARYMLPMHWGSFKLTLEPIAEPAINLRDQIAARQMDPQRVPILALGETWALP